MLFYTKVSPDPREARAANEQWAARSDEAMLTWEKHPANPILSLETHGGPAFEGSWRDPFIFEAAGRTFMVLGAALADEATVALYEAADQSLARWTYQGLLYTRPRPERPFFECPNFFELEGQWVLITAPYRPLEYAIGAFDLASLIFTPAREGVLDYGQSPDPEQGYGSQAEFYASNILFDPQERCILLGWVRGFQAGRGWNGCLALPRLLTLGPDGHPRQRPIPELQQLRQNPAGLTGLRLADSRYLLETVRGDCLEIQVVFALGSAEAVGLKVRRSEDGHKAVSLRYDGQILDVAGTQVPFELSGTEPGFELHLFLDKSVLEVFVNGGRAAVTRVIYPGEQDLGVELFAEGGQAEITSCQVWEMGSSW